MNAHQACARLHPNTHTLTHATNCARAGARVGARGRDPRGGAAVVAGQRRGVVHPGALRVLTAATHVRLHLGSLL